MFENAFKNIDNILHTDSGSATELDYVEQTSWILFLKYLDDLDEIKKTEAALAGKKYEYILDPQHRWDAWACPKGANGKIDYQKAQDGDDLNDFVNGKLFPYLKKFKNPDADANTIEYKIGEIFSELKNKISSGYKLRDILNIVDGMHFRLYEEKHELSHLYEDKIKNMGNAGRNGGEYYTPRPLIKTIVKVVAPTIGETIYDGACGSAGFLVESYNFLTQNQAKLSSAQMATLQNKTFYGKEIKSLAYIIGIMNMILHGIEAPNIRHMDTLAQNINDIQEKDRYNVILANPPFGAGIGREIQQNFPIKTGETAFLFLQHFIKILKAGLPAPRPTSGQFCIYVLKCSDSSFYVGQTEDFLRRLDDHRLKKVAWTASRLPVEPIHWEIFGTREEAVKREHDLKTGFGRKWLKREYEKGALMAARQAGGRAGIVIKNTFLSNTDNASVSLRKLLLESCNLHTVLDLPGGVFAGAGVKTVVLFFEKGKPTKKVWFYQLNLGRNLGKGNPLNEADLAEFVKLQKTKADSDNSWSVDVSSVNQETFDLSVKNPNKGEEVALRSPKEILAEMKELDKTTSEILIKIKNLI